MSIFVKKLVKRYGKVAVVHSISFEVAKGEFVSLLGPSGCGKTTTLRCIAGLEESNGGTIGIDSEIVSSPEKNINVPPHDRQIGMVFQSYAIWPHMSVLQNVGFPLTIRKVPKDQVRKQAEEALSLVDMVHLKDRAPSQLSGGQQQRVALARAIVGQPRVLLFDEPLSNLDAKLRESTRSEIQRLQRRMNVAAVYVTHDQEEALSMSDRVIVMDRGHIMQAGAPKELYRAPNNHFVANFVGRASFVPVKQNGEGWKTVDGTPIRVSRPPVHQADDMHLMLRPEAIALERPAQAYDADGLNRLPGIIQEGHYMGAYTEYYVRAGGGVIKAHSAHDFEPEERVSITFTPEHGLLIAAAD